jgi:phosphate butyryltransferase
MSDRNPTCVGFDQILALARERFESRPKPRAVMTAYASPLSLQAFERAYLAELIDPVVVGDPALFEREIAKYAPGLSSVEMIDEEHPIDSIHIVADMVAAGEVDLVVHGGIMSASLIRELIIGESKLAHPGKVISHVAVAESSAYHKILLLSDGVVHDQPDLTAKIGILQNLIGLAHCIGVSKPKIGVLAAVEVVYPQMPVTIEAAVLAKMADREQIKGAYVDGPISVDVALDPLAAQAKGVIKSDVAGDADGFVAPNAATAHGMYQALQFWGECKIGGVVLGAQVPLALSFPSDSIDTRFHSILLAVMAAKM